LKRLLILHNDLQYFLSHRLRVAHAAKACGWQIEIAVPNHPRCQELRDEGLTWHPTELVRSRAAPLVDGNYIFHVLGLLRSRSPDLVHAFSIKPVLLGGLGLRLYAASHRRRIPFVATVSGLGMVFQNHRTSMAARLTRLAVEQLYRRIIQYEPSIFTFEHSADFHFFTSRLGLPPDRGTVMPGAGIDLNAYRRGDQRHSKFRILFASRLLRSKGVFEFVEAAALTDRDDIEWLIAGSRDPGSADSLTEDEVRALGGGRVTLLGHVHDMAGLLSEVDAVALPSRYPEGIPRILIEAAASGAVPIAGNFPGARALIEDGVSGIILGEPPTPSLASTALRLVDDRDLRERLGAVARRRVESGGYDEWAIAERFLQIYDRLTERAHDMGPGATSGP
jgi:glycosyltransferase involved in cell wall biosynthesis